MKKVVITGATGMIGKTLIEYLLKKDIEILAVIRQNSKRGQDLPKHQNLKIVGCNLDNLRNLKIQEKYDTFFHFAWDGTFGEARNDLYIQNLNVKYTLDAVELANNLGCTTFIGAGSQAEYGRVEGRISEETSQNPENGYGIAKLTASRMSRILANKYNIKHIWTRIFSAYGPYDGEKTMIMSSIKEMLENKRSPNYTKGEQIWDYIYSEDVAKAFYLIGEKGKNNSVYCIAQGESRPLYEYIQIIKDAIDKSIKLNLGVIPYSEKQVMNLQANIDKLKTDTGFTPEFTFEKGIQNTIKWYKEKEGKNEKN